MVKLALTRHLEKLIYEHTSAGDWNIFSCFEVMIGISGDEIVDFITTSATNEIRCYEIKTSKSDLNSNARKTFVGDFNYFVMPQALWDDLNKHSKWEAYNGVGVLIDNGNFLECVRNAKRKHIHFAERAKIMESLVRSMSREIKKFYKIKGYWEAF
ncbi:hypothetical protein [Listeria booriae]|uniref:Uncharacterized protein n=1 Tax=Listeria booriae TaxID=1552123 RepID=A0A7X0Z903_9LIST|nr:hypothetical protein [Listeria booriae]MBC1914185.1 hypothetical protein [Listeria booriae]MBC2173941.1 hypothetical protein [Listeria booriae]MBC2178201.1 hypothetical protein [Listeria booriae]MBC2178272.1 hypothetical protein [Listeria booriae]MDT0111638.1 hypothetical protein [Listeria booriae]